MKLTEAELDRLAMLTATNRLPPPPPALPGLEEVTTLAALIDYRRARLARG